MASFRARSASAIERTDLYQDITAAIIAQLEEGRVPWVQPWDSAAAALDLPVNASTRARYSGINILILWNAMIERGLPHPSLPQWLLANFLPLPLRGIPRADKKDWRTAILRWRCGPDGCGGPMSCLHPAIETATGAGSKH